MTIPYTKPYLTGVEIEMLQRVLRGPKLSGNGGYTQLCQQWLSENLHSQKVLLTQSCTNAIEMAALLLDLKPGDEIILPSFTFVSSANPFVLRGVVPVFVDIRPDTLNIDETKIEAAITPRTRAIMPVHYAGVACEMQTILSIAKQHDLFVVPDSAQAIQSFYRGKPTASYGDLSALSFHDTKNISSGEGGALLINDQRFNDRSEILWEKGTNRSRFLRGEVDKYTWVDVGSSFLPSELTASFLWAQLGQAQQITDMRMSVWKSYYKQTADLEAQGFLRRPTIPDDCVHNAHIFYVLLDSQLNREACIRFLKERGIQAVSHYVPLHSSPAGLRFGRASGNLENTDLLSEQILRLPLWPGLRETDEVVSALTDFCLQSRGSL